MGRGRRSTRAASLVPSPRPAPDPPKTAEPDARLHEVLAPQLWSPNADHLRQTHDVLLMELPASEGDERAKPRSDDDDDDSTVVYQFSRSGLFKGKGVEQFAGAFITLFCELEAKMTKSAPCTTRLEVAGTAVQCVYRRVMRRYLLVVAASDTIATEDQLCAYTDSALATLAHVHGSLEVAFLGSVERRVRLDCFFSTMFKRLCCLFGSAAASKAGAVVQHSCASDLASRSGHCFILDTSLEEKLELVDTFGMPETNVATAKLDRAEACLCVGTAVYLHGVNVHNDLATRAFKGVTGVCAHYGLLRATAEGSVPPLTVWTDVYDMGANPADRETRPCYVLMVANRHSVIAKVLQAWHGGKRSQHERAPGPDQMQIQDSRLQSHMLHVNGTLNRIARNIHVDRLHPNAAGTRVQWSRSGSGAGAGSSGPGALKRSDTGVTSSMQQHAPRSPTRKRTVRRGKGPVDSLRSLSASSQSLDEIGEDRAIYDYLALGDHRGVLCFDTQAFPTDQSRATLRFEISRHFYSACEQISQVLRPQGGASEPFQPAGMLLGCVKEHGVLIHLHDRLSRVGDPGPDRVLRRTASLPLPTEAIIADDEPPVAAFWVSVCDADPPPRRAALVSLPRAPRAPPVSFLFAGPRVGRRLWRCRLPPPARAACPTAPRPARPCTPTPRTP